MKLKDIVSFLPNFYDETIRLDIISSATDECIYIVSLLPNFYIISSATNECIYKIDESPTKYLKDISVYKSHKDYKIKMISAEKTEYGDPYIVVTLIAEGDRLPPTSEKGNRWTKK